MKRSSRWRKSRSAFLTRMNLWDEILARIETKVNRHSFYTWFKPTTFVAEDRTSITRPRAERAVQGLAHQALLGRHRRGDGRIEAAERSSVNFVAESRRRTVRRSSSAPTKRRRSRRARRCRPVARTRGTQSRATPSTRSSSARRISSRTRRAARSPKRRRAPTTRCSSTAAWVSARRT